MSSVWAVVRADLRSEGRNPRALAARLLPLVLLLGGMAFSMATGRGADDDEPELRPVGIATASPAVGGVGCARCQEYGLELLEVDDLERAVGDGSLDAALVGSEEGRLQILSRVDDVTSVDAARRLRVLAAEDGSEPVAVVVEIEPDVDDVRRGLAVAMPAVLLAVGGYAVTTTGRRLRDHHRSGRLAVLLTAPLRSSALVLALSLTEGILTLAVMSPIWVLLSIGGAVVAGSELGMAGGLEVGLLAVTTVVASTVLACLVTVALLARRLDRADPAALVLVPVLAGAVPALHHLLVDGEVSTAWSVAPMVGLADAVRAAMIGELQVGLVVAALLSTLLVTAWVSNLAGIAARSEVAGRRAA